MTDPGGPTRPGTPVSRLEALVIGLVAAVVTVISAKGHLPGLGNDATSYVAIADNLARHGRLGYFLEPRLTLWPPGWPATLAFSEWAFGIRPQISALAINAATVIAITFEARWLMTRLSKDRRLVLAATLIAALGPATLSQSYEVQTEITFMALVLISFIALIRFSDTRRMSWLAVAAVAQWAAFMDRYVGIVSIGAGALWLLFERGRETPFAIRFRNAVGWGVAAFVVPGIWLIRNISVAGKFASAFGPRDTPTATYKTNAVDAATSIGQFVHGVSKYAPFTGILRALSLLLAVVVGAIAIELYRRALAARGASLTDRASFAAALGSPAGLLVIYALAHWLYMIYSASTIAFDPVNTRYLMPMFIPAMLAGLALVDRGGLPRPGVPADAFTRFVGAAVVALVVVQVGVGLVRASASYWDESALGYDAPTWQTTLHSKVLDSLPGDCRRLYANFPEAMYLAFPHIEAQRSPRIRKFASSDQLHELADMTRAVERGERTCLVWVRPSVLATPTYQHTLRQIEDKVRLAKIAGDGHVTIYTASPLATSSS